MSYDPTNVFARILRGELPCDKVYEDEYVLAFRDINPQTVVHVLVIPKGAYVSMDDFAGKASAAEIAELFAEVVIAPGFEPEARVALVGKKNLRLLAAGAMADPAAPGMTFKSLAGGILLQTRDGGQIGREVERHDALAGHCRGLDTASARAAACGGSCTGRVCPLRSLQVAG